MVEHRTEIIGTARMPAKWILFMVPSELLLLLEGPDGPVGVVVAALRTCQHEHIS